jgi:heat shock protein HslJ
MSRFRVVGLAIGIIVAVVATFLTVYSAQNVPLTGTSWRLVSIDGISVERNIILTFKTREFYGDTSCNVYHGEYMKIADHISISTVEHTDVGCENVEQEIAFFEALFEAQRAEHRNGTLTIKGSHVLVFEPEDKR